MSDPLRHHFQPHVYIDGRKLSSSAEFDGLTALADFTIRWGSSDWYSNIEPSELRLAIIDPLGEFLNVTATEGIAVEIRRDDPWTGPESVRIFRGIVTATDSELSHWTHPRTGRRIEAWTVTLTAVDPLGQLAQDRRHGPKFPDREPAEKRMHWGPGTMAERKQALDERSPVPIVWEPTELDQYDDEEWFAFYPVASYETQQNVSALTVLRNTARISRITNRPYYSPHWDAIRFMREPTYMPLRNAADGSVEFHTTTVPILDGARFAPTEGFVARSSATEQVTKIEFVRRYESYNDQDIPYLESVEISKELTAVTAPAQTTVSLETDQSAAFDYWPDIDMVAYHFVRSIYGRQRMSPLEWLLRDDETTTGWLRNLLSAEPHMGPNGPTVFAFKNSLMNWPAETGQFCFIGGELSYSATGWNVILNPVPAPSRPNWLTVATPELGDITRTHTLASAPADIFVADLTKINVAT